MSDLSKNIEVAEAFDLKSRIGNSLGRSPEAIRTWKRLVQEQSMTSIIYNIAMSRFSVDSGDREVSKMVKASEYETIGEKSSDRMFQERTILLHMTADDQPIIVHAWSDPIEIPEDIDAGEGIARQDRALINLYEKLIQFWKSKGNIRVIGYFPEE